MSEVRILLRWVLLMTAALVFTTCKSAGNAYAPSPGAGSLAANPCKAGTGKDHRNAPIVCVDDSGATLSVHPDPITIDDEGAGRVPVMIHWWTRSGGGELGIEVQPGCVTDVSCSGGHCSARTLPKDGGGARCKYDVWTATKPRLDPEIIIVDCCDP